MEGVSDICCFVECSLWKLVVVAMREPIITVTVGDKQLAMSVQSDGEQLTALWFGLAALSQ